MSRLGSNASPFGLTPTAILKAFRSSEGANAEIVSSPRLLVKTRSRVSETSAPATPVRSGIDSMYRSRTQSITSIESHCWYVRRRADPWVHEYRRDRSRHWIDAPGVRCGRVNEVPSLLTSVRFFPLDYGISEQRTQSWFLASKMGDRVGGRLVTSTELLDRRRL